MQLRHFGVLVNHASRVESFLVRLGLTKTYDEIETFDSLKVRVCKFSFPGGGTFEIIEDTAIHLQSFHLCVDGGVPDWLRQAAFRVEEGTPHNPNLKSEFVYIGDTIYFEFVENKNGL